MTAKKTSIRLEEIEQELDSGEKFSATSLQDRAMSSLSSNEILALCLVLLFNYSKNVQEYLSLH